MDEQGSWLYVTGDTLTQAAITAANKSYMPYSHSHRAAWLDVKMAVFSPAAMRKTPPLTLRRFPLQGALNLLSLNGYDYAG